MFRAAFHTGYVPCGVLRLSKAQLDGSCSDSRFSEDFFIDLIFAPIEKVSGVGADGGASAATPSAAQLQNQPPNTIGVVGAPSDSGLLIHATSADRYELTLHRDTRFWDAVAARKSKSKKRHSRKFTSATQEQFSITGDDSMSRGEEAESRSRAALAKSKAASGMASNMSDLIMQLARAEEDSLGEDSEAHSAGAVEVPFSSSFSSSSSSAPSSSSSSGSNSASISTSSSTAANLELQALEDLEKELGLGDLNLFASSSSAAHEGDSSSSSTGEGSGKGSSGNGGTKEEDNLDELDDLEAYLQSLNP